MIHKPFLHTVFPNLQVSSSKRPRWTSTRRFLFATLWNFKISITGYPEPPTITQRRIILKWWKERRYGQRESIVINGAFTFSFILTAFSFLVFGRTFSIRRGTVIIDFQGPISPLPPPFHTLELNHARFNATKPLPSCHWKLTLDILFEMQEGLSKSVIRFGRSMVNSKLWSMSVLHRGSCPSLWLLSLTTTPKHRLLLYLGIDLACVSRSSYRR